MSCSICVEDYNRSTRKRIQCQYCDLDACATCSERFLLMETTRDPTCMGCNKVWTLDFLTTNFTKKFVNDAYKKHREKQLFDREVAMLPATQPLVEREISRRKLQDQRQELMVKRDALKKELATINDGIDTLQGLVYRLNSGVSVDAIMKEKRQFVRRCTFEGCRGFLSTQWKCGVCENYVCSDCLEVKGHERDGPHVCKPENVETAKLIAKDTKPCPNCGEMINKYVGCAQVWCTSCHTAWDWNTCRIERGAIHNPHFFEYQRLNQGTMPRPIGDMPCGGIPQIGEIRTVFKRLNLDMNRLLVDGNYYSVYDYMRLVSHLYNVERQHFIVNRLTDNADLRIKYMLKEVDEKRLMQLLQQREKARNKKQEIEQVIDMIYTVSTDMLRNMHAAKVDDEIYTIMRQVIDLVKFSKDGMENIRNKYGGVVPDFEILRAL